MKEKAIKDKNNKVSESIEKVWGLNDFIETYSDDEVTPLIYFEDGMKAAHTPFNTIKGIALQLYKNDESFIYNIKEPQDIMESIQSRKNSVRLQFESRINFLGRSLALNLTQKLEYAMSEFNIPFHCPDEFIKTINYKISSAFYKFMQHYNFSSLEKNNDEYYTYLINSTVIPLLIAQIYDKFDAQLISVITIRSIPTRDMKEKGETYENTHLNILNKIAPYFEMLKSQLEWMSYILRYEALIIYKPMIFSDNIIEKCKLIKFECDDSPSVDEIEI